MKRGETWRNVIGMRITRAKDEGGEGGEEWRDVNRVNFGKLGMKLTL